MRLCLGICRICDYSRGLFTANKTSGLPGDLVPSRSEGHCWFASWADKERPLGPPTPGWTSLPRGRRPGRGQAALSTGIFLRRGR